MRKQFPGWIIYRKGDINWTPRSCDLSPLDYIVRDYVKSQVYKNNSKSISELKHEIISVISLNYVEMKLKISTKKWTFVGLHKEAIWQILFLVHKYHNFNYLWRVFWDECKLCVSLFFEQPPIDTSFSFMFHNEEIIILCCEKRQTLGYIRTTWYRYFEYFHWFSVP